MTTEEIVRLAKQMLTVEKDPDNTELARKHRAEWAQVPWEYRGLILKETKLWG